MDTNRERLPRAGRNLKPIRIEVQAQGEGPIEAPHARPRKMQSMNHDILAVGDDTAATLTGNRCVERVQRNGALGGWDSLSH